MARLLTEEEVADVLARLPAWSGGRDRLVRTVAVAGTSERAAFADAVQRLGDAVDHHAVVEATDDGVRLVLWTHTAGGVTARDADLAARLDELLSASD
jgi:4a-hydroxytetrahydrobiopterin dehydratase